MVKAQIALANGTSITVDGTMDEIKHLLDYYGGDRTSAHGVGAAPPAKRTRGKKAPAVTAPASKGEKGGDVPLAEIVNLVKNCDDADKIEKQILDRTSQVNRILLPLYIVHEHLHDAHALTTGEISKITSDLGIPVQTPNVSRSLTTSASRYVMGDRVRKKGQPVRYRLSRRGVKYLHAVIEGKEDGE
jgi:hypothetical protein